LEESRDDLQSLGYDTPVPLIRSRLVHHSAGRNPVLGDTPPLLIEWLPEPHDTPSRLPSAHASALGDVTLPLSLCISSREQAQPLL
ncbi:hypothetical protein, partial [Mycobacteroides abscessus]|uniref:hypothetical protein n=1 Tax=Mycobacteroides abscessus TaxID=36809 RepID=UPI001A99A23B